MRQLVCAWIFVAMLWGCRYVGTLTPLRNDAALSSTQASSDPTRRGPVVARRCVVECGAGFVCDETEGRCESARPLARDGGVRWLP